MGRGAPALVEPFLKTRRPLDLERMDAGELRLCRWVDGDQTIDDALITVRRQPSGEAVVDISLHGGPRIVQRVLMMLKRAGARIVDRMDLVRESWPAAGTVEQEMLQLLLTAKTRAVASWLIGMPGRLSTQIDRIIRDLHTGQLAPARSSLARLCDHAGRVPYLLDGVRVVLIGEPNAGKSMLANILAEREHAIVSDLPGTTRDWVEHPGAIEGAPFTFVDTAGLGQSRDPIEREAVRRARRQVASADIVLRVIDGSQPPAPADRQAVEDHREQRRRDHVRRKELFAWNKSDLPRRAEYLALMARVAKAGVAVSARTGAGLAELRRKLSQTVGLDNWPGEMPAPFTARQIKACRRALSALTRAEPDRPGAVRWLNRVIGPAFSPEDRP